MSYDYDRRGGSLGPSSTGAGSNTGVPGKRTLTEQIQMRPAEQAAPTGSGTGAAGDEQAAAATAPHVDVANHGQPEVQPSGGSSRPLSALAARQLLQNAFGTYRQISEGQVRVLAQADFQTAYDAIYGNGQYSWARYVVPRFGNLNGFAYGGVNYINNNAADVTTVPHEMLHTNVASDWRPIVGSPFDEGATEYLEQHALHTGGINSNLTHYPNQRAVVDAYIAAGATQDALFRAYLVGGANTLVAQWVDQHCQGTWAQVKTATEQSQWAVARASLARRTGGAQPAPGGTSPAPGGTGPTPAPTTPPTGGPP